MSSGRSLITRRESLAVAALLLAACALRRPSQELPERSRQVDISDLLSFRTWHAEIAAGRIGVAQAAERYLAGAGPGLRAYRDAYGLTATRMAEGFNEHRHTYDMLAALPLSAIPVRRIARVAERLRALEPAMAAAPIFLFTGATGLGATVKEVTPSGGEDGLGVLVPLEMVLLADRTPDAPPVQGQPLALLPQFVGHELTHVAQVRVQGLTRYRSIYTDPRRGTNLAVAIREGAADLLSQLTSGQLRERHRFFEASKREIWEEFRASLSASAQTSGWFSVPRRATGPRPAALGYAVGWWICTRLYERRGRSGEALRQILSAVEPADFDAILAGADVG